MLSARQALCAAAAAAAVCWASAAFVLPSGAATRAGALPAGQAGATQEPKARGFGAAAAVAFIGAHAGLAAAVYGRTARRAEGKYVESAVDAKLFEQVYLDYTTEYLKGPMYAHREKQQGVRPDYPGNPLYKNGKMTSNVTGNLKTFSSNELMYLSMLFFGIGLYGNLQFLYFDPQFPRVDSGLNFNVSYIVESLFLPISFFMHIACYIQRKNGK